MPTQPEHENRPIVLLSLGQTLSWAGLYYSFPALLLRWEQELGWSKADLTAAISLAVLTSASASPLAGRIIDKGYGAALMAGAAFCGGVGLILLSFVNSLWQFYFVWAMIGLTMAGSLYEPCFALLTRARGKDAKQGIIFITLIAGFVSTISFPLMYSLSESLGWRMAIILTGLMTIILVVPLNWFGAQALEATTKKLQYVQSPSQETHNAFLKRPAFWFLAFGFAAVALVHGAILHHLLPLLDDYGLSDEMAVLAASFIGPMQVAGRLAMMALEKYISHHRLAVSAFLMMGLSVMLLMLSSSSPVFLSGFVILFGAAYGTVSILRPILARDLLGERNFGAKSGALALYYLLGSASAPYLGSMIWGIGGYNAMLPTLIIIAVIGCSAYLVAHRLTA